MFRMTCAVVASLLFATIVSAQPKPVLSPRDSSFLKLDTNIVSVNYGRPSIRGRVIMGELVPWGKVWRTGANQATHFKTNFDMTLGGIPVPRGTYTLWTLPGPDGWKIIINKQTSQWGTVYDERLDLARFPATVEALSAVVDTFKIWFEKSGPTSGKLVMAWEKTRVSAAIEKNDHIRPLSPTDSAQANVNGANLKVVYSRPYERGRAIWGMVVPFDSVWRTGANAGTLLTTDAEVTVGGVHLPKGEYLIRSIPAKDSFTLLISHRPTAPGPIPESLMVGKTSMTQSHSSVDIDPFRIWFEPAGAQTRMSLGWADRVYSTTIEK